MCSLESYDLLVGEKSTQEVLLRSPKLQCGTSSRLLKWSLLHHLFTLPIDFKLSQNLSRCFFLQWSHPHVPLELLWYLLKNPNQTLNLRKESSFNGTLQTTAKNSISLMGCSEAVSPRCLEWHFYARCLIFQRNNFLQTLYSIMCHIF